MRNKFGQACSVVFLLTKKEVWNDFLYDDYLKVVQLRYIWIVNMFLRNVKNLVELKLGLR